MKKKALSYYLDLMKFALDKQDWNKTKHYGEIALKKLSNLSYLPIEEYLLYCRLGYAYYYLTEYSRSLEAFHKDYLIAIKKDLPPAYSAYAIFGIGGCFLLMRSVNQALRHFHKVDQYYKKYGTTTLPMNESTYFNNLISMGFCHLHKNNLKVVQEIVEIKLSPYLKSMTNPNVLANYYSLGGHCLIALKKYGEARQSFQKTAENYQRLKLDSELLNAKIHLALIGLLEGQLEFTISFLKSLLKEARFLKCYDSIYEIGFLLSKCYLLKNLPRKALSIEKNIKPIINKLDINWLYEKNREIEQLYRLLQSIYKTIPIKNKAVSGILAQALNQRYEDLPYHIVGQSTSTYEVYQLIEKIAATDLPVLIQGETGTGKELIARAIHQNSIRNGKVWLAINCGTLSATLLENELFGHIKNAFTDAKNDKKGYIELASEGTLFLDEIAEMSSAMQQKLLRVMDEKLVWPVGSEKSIPVNTRFVFASNQNIEELVKTKKFRGDLYYRINTIVITLPPLKDRKEDIPLLVNHFINKIDKNEAKDEYRRKEMTEEALRVLSDYNWPGNVRELENEIKRICALYPHAKNITLEMLSETIRNYKPSLLYNPLKKARESAEKNIIIDALKKCNGNIAQTSRYLNYPRPHLYRKMSQLNIPLNNDVTNK
jgi:DNA-binding NtrC family response regulator